MPELLQLNWLLPKPEASRKNKEAKKPQEQYVILPISDVSTHFHVVEPHVNYGPIMCYWAPLSPSSYNFLLSFSQCAGPQASHQPSQVQHDGGFKAGSVANVVYSSCLSEYFVTSKKNYVSKYCNSFSRRCKVMDNYVSANTNFMDILPSR
jgi:hypothetical protein